MKKTFVAIVGIIICTSVAFAGSKEKKINVGTLNKVVAETQQARIDFGKLTGSQVVVWQGKEEVLNALYGHKNAAGDILTGNETYRIASMTKPVTGLALLIEHERGHLNIYDDVAKYLPEFADMKLKDGTKAKNSIKIYMLVSHCSGVGEVDVKPETTLDSAVEYLAGQPLNYDPGTSQAYSTGAFDVAAKIIEKVSGMEFEEYLKANIFDKLGMKDTTFEPNADQWQRMVGMQGRDENGKAFDSKVWENCVFASFPATYHAAGAGLMSTADDYAKFARMLLYGGKIPGYPRVIGKKALALFSQPVPYDYGQNPPAQQWGMGVRVIMGENPLPLGAFGWSGAFGTHFWVDPSNKLAVVYMKNSSYDGGSGAMTAFEIEESVMKAM